MNRLFLAVIVIPLIGFACTENRQISEHRQSVAGDTTISSAATATEPDRPLPKQWRLKVVRTLPHDKTCYTQGLEIHDGAMYETGGLVGRSTLRKIDMSTWKSLQTVKLPAEVFGEGLTLFDAKIYTLTWRDERCLIYSANNLNLIGETNYTGEGWGLCNDGESLIMTNGSNTITFLDPKDFRIRRIVSVFDNGRPVSELNEAEYIDGEIWANIYQSNNIVRINPQTGDILGWIDAAGLLSEADITAGAEVLNGIAYDSATKSVYLTGKLWPKLFEVKLEQLK
ncbi:glutaminyl-peptide cyclotransferase [Ignavibacteria bacterium]